MLYVWQRCTELCASAGHRGHPGLAWIHGSRRILILTLYHRILDTYGYIGMRTPQSAHTDTSVVSAYRSQYADTGIPWLCMSETPKSTARRRVYNG